MIRTHWFEAPSWRSSLAGIFCALFAFFMLPGQDVRSVLYEPRVWLLAGFVGLWTTFALVSDRETRLKDIPRGLRALPGYEKLLLAYMGSMLLSSVTSPVPGFALLGDPITSTGSLFQCLLFGIFFIFRRLTKPAHIVPALAVTTICLVLVNVSESLGARPALAFFPDTYIGAYPRAGIGRESVIGGIYVLFAGMALSNLLDPRTSRALGLGWLLAAFVGIMLNPGKASWLGFAAVSAAFTAATFYARRRQALAKAFACAVVAVLVTIIVSAIAAKAGTSNVALEERVATTTTLHTRLLLWKASWRMLLERPLLGWGDDNFKLEVFNHLSEDEAARLCRLEFGVLPEHRTRAFGNVCMMQDQEGNLLGLEAIDYIWPHNILAQIAVSHGVIGLGLFLAFLVSLGLTLVSRGQRRVFWLLGPAGFLVYLMGFFYIVPIAPYFWLSLGLAANDANVPVGSASNPVAKVRST